MEHAINIEDSDIDDNYIKYIGYSEPNNYIKKYYSKETVKIISNKVTQLTLGVDPQKRPIVVPDTTIHSVMNDIYTSYRPPTGDIYSRYVIPSGTGTDNYIQNMIDQVIEVIVSDIKTNIGMEENNKKLSIWTTVYGDFNENSLRQHPPIKVRNKKPASMQFNMNY